MANRLDPITQAAVDNARELGLVLSELNEAEITARAHALRAQAHADLWSALFRAIGRLFGRSQTRTAATEVKATPTLVQDISQDLVANGETRLAA